MALLTPTHVTRSSRSLSGVGPGSAQAPAEPGSPAEQEGNRPCSQAVPAGPELCGERPPPPVGCSPVPIALVTVPAVLGERPLYSHHGRPQSSLLTQVPSTPALKGGSSPVGGQWAPSGGAAGVGILGGFRQQGGHWL